MVVGLVPLVRLLQLALVEGLEREAWVDLEALAACS